MNKIEGTAQQHMSTNTSNLVVPNCVQNRTFIVNSQTSDGKAKFSIKELLTGQDVASAEKWKKYDTCVCEVDKNKFGRVIGRVNVIGCQDNHIVLQVIFNGHQGICFIYANLSTGSMHVIPNEIQYFPWNVIYKGNVQCLLSPDLSCAVFGLPHNYMSPIKNFKLLLSDIMQVEDHLEFQGIKDTRLSLKKYKMIAFDPRKPHHATLLHINPYCYKCGIEVWDLKNDICILCKKIIKTGKSTTIPAKESQNENTMLRTAEYSSDIQLLQTHMSYSKAGKYLIISCLAILNDFVVPQVRVIILDSNTFQVVKNVCFLLESDQPLPSLFVSSMDNTDTKVILWSHIRERAPEQIGEVCLPPDITLQAVCRRIILTHCSSDQVDRLPLPQEIIRMLQFRFLH